MSQPHLIDQLGGTGAVALALRQNDNTVSMWKARGIPWKWRPRIAELAAQNRVPLPDGFLNPEEKAA